MYFEDPPTTLRQCGRPTIKKAIAMTLNTITLNQLLEEELLALDADTLLNDLSDFLVDVNINYLQLREIACDSRHSLPTKLIFYEHKVLIGWEGVEPKLGLPRRHNCCRLCC